MAQRELRRQGAACPLQPQVFCFLLYLVQHRERVVTKQELLSALWPDVAVTDGSLQRIVSLARSALEPFGRQFIRTYTGHGYRCIARVEAEQHPASHDETRFAPRYAKSGDVHVAYCALGAGDVDIVIVLGWVFPMQALFSLPEALAALDQFAQLGRVITFDKRGTGLSDRVKELPTLAQRMDDLRAVLDELRSERAVLLGISEGGPLSIAFAERYPERVAGLALVGAFPRMTTAPDYPYGWPRSELGRLKSYVTNHWGDGATLLALLPEAHQARCRDWACAAERAGASPGAALDLLEMNARIDVRDKLATLRVPTLVLHARNDRISALDNGRFLAESIPGARLHELDGDDHAFLFHGQPLVVTALRQLVALDSAR